ncbi:MAG: transposase-like protein, partial [Candidatus Azotimanducaceae bacterium]
VIAEGYHSRYWQIIQYAVWLYFRFNVSHRRVRPIHRGLADSKMGCRDSRINQVVVQQVWIEIRRQIA